MTFTGLVIGDMEVIPLNTALVGFLVALTALCWTIIQHLQLKNISKKEVEILPVCEGNIIPRQVPDSAQMGIPPQAEVVTQLFQNLADAKNSEHENQKEKVLPGTPKEAIKV